MLESALYILLLYLNYSKCVTVNFFCIGTVLALNKGHPIDQQSSLYYLRTRDSFLVPLNWKHNTNRQWTFCSSGASAKAVPPMLISFSAMHRSCLFHFQCKDLNHSLPKKSWAHIFSFYLARISLHVKVIFPSPK